MNWLPLLVTLIVFCQIIPFSSSYNNIWIFADLTFFFFITFLVLFCFILILLFVSSLHFFLNIFSLIITFNIFFADRYNWLYSIIQIFKIKCIRKNNLIIIGDIIKYFMSILYYKILIADFIYIFKFKRLLFNNWNILLNTLRFINDLFLWTI